MTGKEPDDNAAGKYSVFFSHKARDCPVAEAIIDLLDRHTENVSFFISEKIEKGTNWRKSIADHLSRSSFLVLLFTDPKEDWGWCLYETGFFDALTQARDSASVRRLYCLHNEATTPPNPISDLQTVSANVDEIEQWLRELFQHTKQNKARFMDAIPGLAVQIRDLFSNPKNELYSESCISLTLDRSAVSSPNELPDDAILSGERSLVAEVFGHGAPGVSAPPWQVCRYGGPRSDERADRASSRPQRRQPVAARCARDALRRDAPALPRGALYTKG